MLTPKQEVELRKYGKDQGYSQEKLDAFIRAKKNEKPPSLFEKKTVAEQPKKEGDGFIKGIVKSVAKPITTGLVTGARTLQSTPQLLKGDVQGANRTMAKLVNLPFFGSTKPLVGMSEKEALVLAGETALDAAGGKIIGVAGKGISRGSKALVGTGSRLLKTAPKAVEEAAESFISTVDNQTKSVLNPSRLIPEATRKKLAKEGVDFTKQATAKREKFDRYLKQAQKALDNPSQMTPLEMAGKRAEEALSIINQKLSKQGSLKGSVIDTVGDTKVGGLTKARLTLEQQLKNKVGAVITKDGVKNARGRISKISLDPEDNNLVVKVYNKLNELKFSDSMRKADDVVDAIQDLLYKRKQNVAVPVNSTVESIVKQSIGELNSIVKRAAGGTYRKSNSKYANLIQLRDQLNKSLGKEANKGGSLMKRVFSPTDGGTKKLFAEIKKATGIDLVEEAALARHVMEITGDPRGNNLLELLNQTGIPTPSNIAVGTGKFFLNKIRDPVKESYKLIEQGKLKP